MANPNIQKRALIVDDSKTAQVRLRKMLERYNLDVEIAFSAEEALGLLGYKDVDVLFLDHHMEGMDGLEALKIIKANPGTAMVPVIMYTAESGDVYVSQARALGAIDILSKDIMEESSIENVLAGLGVLPKEIGEMENTQVTQSISSQAVNINEMSANANVFHIPSGPREPSSQQTLGQIQHSLDRMKGELNRSFDIHLSDVRNQIAENGGYVVQRLSAELRQNDKRKVNDNDATLSAISAELSWQWSRSKNSFNWLMSLFGITVIVFAVMGYFLFLANTKVENIQQSYTELLTYLQNQNSLIETQIANSNIQQPAVPTSNTSLNTRLLNLLSSAMDGDIVFEYGQQPLGKTQIDQISALVTQLNNAGYKGRILLDIHMGNFCLQEAAANTFQISNDDQSVINCVYYQNILTDANTNDFISINYTNYEQTEAAIQNGNILLVVDYKSFTKPLINYPSLASNPSSAEWNNVARKNNRISVTFEPEY